MADKITTEKLLGYREHRGSQGASASTANRELSLLRNCLRTAAHVTPPLLPLTAIPRFPITNEDASARQGFLEDDAFHRLAAELPSYLVPIAVVGYNTGIRRGELLRLEWDQVEAIGLANRLKYFRIFGAERGTCSPVGD